VTSAEGVLRLNDRGDFTVPSGSLYPFQWLWDAAFIALGWSTIDAARAWDELDSVVRGQWDDGMMPHVVYHHPSALYFPDPDIWDVGRTPPTSGITQPPVLTSVVLALTRAGASDPATLERARRLWPALLACHHWFHTARADAGTGLVASFHPWETGMDNSPPWDGPLARVPVGELAPYERKDTVAVAAEQRPTTKEYDAYVAIVMHMRSVAYDQRVLLERAPFAVADVGTNAILARADADLVELARLLHVDTADPEHWAESSKASLQELWDGAAGCFYSRDLRTGTTLGPATGASFLPLWSSAISSDQADALCHHLTRWESAAGALVPSTDPFSPAYDASRYWRGPVWLNVNWMVAEGLRATGNDGLAGRVADHSARLVSQSGMREYFDPGSGAGLGAADFGWTAALARYWLEMD
jgi:hypothetical protein